MTDWTPPTGLLGPALTALAGVPVVVNPAAKPGRVQLTTDPSSTDPEHPALVIHVDSRETFDRWKHLDDLRAEGRAIAQRVVEAGFAAMGLPTQPELDALRMIGAPPTSRNLAKLRALGVIPRTKRTWPEHPYNFEPSITGLDVLAAIRAHQPRG